VTRCTNFLAARKFELIVLHWFERMKLSDDYGGEDPYVDSSVVARLGKELVIREGHRKRTERDPEPRR
jgi:hypothetical protein